MQNNLLRNEPLVSNNGYRSVDLKNQRRDGMENLLQQQSCLEYFLHGRRATYGGAIPLPEGALGNQKTDLVFRQQIDQTITDAPFHDEMSYLMWYYTLSKKTKGGNTPDMAYCILRRVPSGAIGLMTLEVKRMHLPLSGDEVTLRMERCLAIVRQLDFTALLSKINLDSRAISTLKEFYRQVLMPLACIAPICQGGAGTVVQVLSDAMMNRFARHKDRLELRLVVRALTRGYELSAVEDNDQTRLVDYLQELEEELRVMQRAG